MSSLLTSIVIKRTVAEWFNFETVRTGGGVGGHVRRVGEVGCWLVELYLVVVVILWGIRQIEDRNCRGWGVRIRQCRALWGGGQLGRWRVGRQVGGVEPGITTGLLGAEVIGIGEREGDLVTRALDRRRLKTCGTSRGRNTGRFASICSSTTYKSNFESGK